MPQEPSTAQEVQTTEITKGRLTISLAKPTPMWVTWIFRTEFVLNKALLLFFYSDLTATQIKVLAFVDFMTWGLGRFVGVTKDTIEK